MIRIAVHGPVGSTRSEAAREVSEAYQAAATALAQALLDLARLRGSLAPRGDQPGDTVAVWHDDNDLYIEARLPEDPGTDIDVSTFGRTLMVRMARADRPICGDSAMKGGAASPGGKSSTGE